MSRRKPFLFLLVAFTFVLTLLSFWVVRQNSVRPSDSFMISNVTINVDLQERRFLTGTVSRFPYGSRQVCLYFDYVRVEEGSEVQVVWRWGGKVVQAETYPIPSPSGSRMYCLLQESGVPLPRGNYTVGIVYRSKAMPVFRFEIY